MVQPNPVLEPPANVGAVGTGEFKPFQLAADGVFFFARADIDAGEILRALRRFQLREMHDIDGASAFAGEPFQRLGQWNFRVGELERDGTVAGLNRDRGPPIAFCEFLLEKGRLAKSRRHQ